MGGTASKAFNAFNQVQFGFPVTDFNRGQFGR